MSGRPPARWRTLGSADFMRVPLPAARTTICVSIKGPERRRRSIIAPAGSSWGAAGPGGGRPAPPAPRGTLHRLPLADVEIQAHPLVELFFFGILTENATEELGRLGIRMALQGLEPFFVDGDRLDVGRSPRRPRRSMRLPANPLVRLGLYRERYARGGRFGCCPDRSEERPALLLGHKRRASLQIAFVARRGP